MLKMEKGFTIFELMVSLFLATILVAALYALIHNYVQLSNGIKSDLQNEVFVNQFIQDFSEEVAQAGYVNPFDDTVLPSPITLSYLNNSLNRVSIVHQLPTDNQQNMILQEVDYEFRTLLPTRLSEYPNEIGVYKRKLFTEKGQSQPLIDFYSASYPDSALLLAGVQSFNCESKTQLDSSGTQGVLGLECLLTIYQKNQSAKTYHFYASRKN